MQNLPGRKTAAPILSINKLKLRALILIAGLCSGLGQAQAGLFSDDEAHKRIQQLVERVTQLEDKLLDISKQQAESSKQQTQAMIDLQSQIEAQNAELRKLRGHNEELVNNLQDAEKRQKDFYVDLDTRLRHIETSAPPAAIIPEPTAPVKAVDRSLPDEDSLVIENRAFEAAYGFFKSGSYQKALDAFEEFLKKFPDSVHVPNVHYQMGNTYFAVNEYSSALDSYQILIRKHSHSPHTPDAMLGVAACQQQLDDNAEAKKTLQQVVAKYPGSVAADTAKKRLKTYK